MEEQKNSGQNQAEKCTCAWCSGRHHRHFFLRILFCVLAISIVFWLGVKAGESRGAFGYGHRGFRGGYPGRYNMMYPGGQYPGPGMMYNYGYGAQGTSTVPAAPQVKQQ